MRRSSLRRSSVVALASTSVGLAAPIPDPAFSLFGGQSSGQVIPSSNVLSGNSLNSLISSLTNLVGQSGTVKTGVNVQAQIEDIFKSFGLNAGTLSSSASPVPSPSASPKGSISGISIGGSGTVNVGNIASAANNVVKQIESTVNGIVPSSGNVAVGFSNPFASGNVQVGSQASISPSPSPRVASPSVSPVIPTASPSPVISTSGSGVGSSGQVGLQAAVNAGQAITSNVVGPASNLVGQVGDQLKSATNAAVNIGKDVTAGTAKTIQSAITNPVSAAASVGVTGTTTTTGSNPLSGLTSILGSGSGSNIFGANLGSLLTPTTNKNLGSGLTSLFQFGHA